MNPLLNITAQQLADAKALPPFVLEMRCAIREGRKTMTRRIIKHIYKHHVPSEGREMDCIRDLDGLLCRVDLLGEDCDENCDFAGHYGLRGAIQYLKEPLVKTAVAGMPGHWAKYGDTGELAISNVTGKMIPWRWKRDTQTAMYMPKEAARLFVRRTITKAERANAISEQDAMAEGITWPDQNGQKYIPPIDFTGLSNLRVAAERFGQLWDSLNAKSKKRNFPFAAGPWCWVIGFERIN